MNSYREMIPASCPHFTYEYVNSNTSRLRWGVSFNLVGNLYNGKWGGVHHAYNSRAHPPLTYKIRDEVRWGQWRIVE
jgi:hypothetical protein